MRTNGTLALFVLVAMGLSHGVAAQCTAGSAVQNPKIGSCPAIAASFTPSWGGDNCMSQTAAQIDTRFSNTLSQHAKAGNGTEAGCKEYYKSIPDIGCFADPNRIKAAPGCDWACAWANMQVKQATDCTGNAGKFKCGDWWWPSCEDMSAMMTAVCTDTAERIKNETDKIRKDGICKDTSNGGVRFNTPAPTPTPTPTPTPIAKSTYTYTYHGCINHLEGGNQPGNFLDSEVLSATSLDECATNCKAKKKPLIGITDIDCPEKPGTFDCHCGATKPVKKFDEAQCLSCSTVTSGSKDKCGGCGWKLSVYSYGMSSSSASSRVFAPGHVVLPTTVLTAIAIVLAPMII